MAQFIIMSTWLLAKFSITVQRLEGLLWEFALSTRQCQGLSKLRHAVVLPVGICSNH